jgi:hypothetical protein
MSNPAVFNQALPARILDTGVMFAVADHLVPLFKTGCDTERAGLIAIGAIDAYQPETRADFFNAARTIAFSMATITLLGKAASDDMPLPEQIRLFGRANMLNRSADQSERTMMQRRRYQRANPREEQPDNRSDLADTPTTDAEMAVGVAEVMRESKAARTPPKTETPAPNPAPEPARPAARIVIPQPPAAIPATAIHTAPRSDAGQPRAATFREGLLQQSALQRVLEAVGAQHAA